MLVLILFLVIIYLFIQIFIGKKSDSVSCLIGKTAVVTGGNSGLGYATSVLLASRGCKVIIADRDDATKSVQEIIERTGNPNIVSKYLDLSSLENIRKFVLDLSKTDEVIDILINNAGVAASAKQFTEDGLNSTMQINYFGAFLLTHLLKGFLKCGSRVIFMGSSTMWSNNLTVENLNGKESVLKTYANSKLCNVFAAQEFAKKLKQFGISTYSVDPGAVNSKIFERTYNITKSFGFVLFGIFVFILFGQNINDGAQTIFHVATHEKLANETGFHYAFTRKWFKPSKLNDNTFCENIWKESEKLVNLKQNEKF